MSVLSIGVAESDTGLAGLGLFFALTNHATSPSTTAATFVKSRFTPAEGACREKRAAA
jgi:hypothetical protein